MSEFFTYWYHKWLHRGLWFKASPTVEGVWRWECACGETWGYKQGHWRSRSTVSTKDPRKRWGGMGKL